LPLPVDVLVIERQRFLESQRRLAVDQQVVVSALPAGLMTPNPIHR
jgi:hypothetical protein